MGGSRAAELKVGDEAPGFPSEFQILDEAILREIEKRTKKWKEALEAGTVKVFKNAGFPLKIICSFHFKTKDQKHSGMRGSVNKRNNLFPFFTDSLLGPASKITKMEIAKAKKEQEK